MMRLNFKGLVAMIGVLFGFAILINDFIAILKGYSFTAFGIATLIYSLVIASECYEYIIDRLER